MARKTIKVNALSQKSIQNCIKQIEAYRDDLPRKCELFVRRLSELGIPVIKQNISSSKGDSDKNYYTHVKINSYGTYSQARLIVEGKDLLFIEFGAGVHYNGNPGGSPHPLGREMGYTIGSYGKGKGKNDFWFYYKDSGESVKSYGTQATMPVYKAGLEIRSKMLKIAKEVFGGD